ncbi:MAG: hypothetical protein ACPGC9_02405 [Cytophagales bacterium]
MKSDSDYNPSEFTAEHSGLHRWKKSLALLFFTFFVGAGTLVPILSYHQYSQTVYGANSTLKGQLANLENQLDEDQVAQFAEEIYQFGKFQGSILERSNRLKTHPLSKQAFSFKEWLLAGAIGGFLLFLISIVF